MTTAIFNQTSPRQTGGMFSVMLERLTANTRRGALRKTLLNMDDHMLRDIGLSRHQVLSGEF